MSGINPWEYAQQRADMAAIGQQNDYIRTKPLNKSDRIIQIQQQMIALHAELEKLTLDDPLDAPTQRLLNNNEALKNAYSEMLVIWRLAGK